MDNGIVSGLINKTIGILNSQDYDLFGCQDLETKLKFTTLIKYSLKSSLTGFLTLERKDEKCFFLPKLRKQEKFYCVCEVMEFSGIGQKYSIKFQTLENRISAEA